MFSSELCEISKNTFSYRTPPVAASEFDRAHCYWDNDGVCLANLKKQIVSSTSNW